MWIQILCGKQIFCRNLYNQEVKTGNYEILSMYMMSQDFIELFFGFLRQRFGCNDNPNAYQIACVYKSLLSLKSIHSVSKGNCEVQKDHRYLTSAHRLKEKLQIFRLM